jgi:hypothetical protein
LPTGGTNVGCGRNTPGRRILGLQSGDPGFEGPAVVTAAGTMTTHGEHRFDGVAAEGAKNWVTLK